MKTPGSAVIEDMLALSEAALLPEALDHEAVADVVQQLRLKGKMQKTPDGYQFRGNPNLMSALVKALKARGVAATAGKSSKTGEWTVYVVEARGANARSLSEDKLKVTPQNFDDVMKRVMAGKSMMWVTTYYKAVPITAKSIKKFDDAGYTLIKVDGSGFRLQQGKSSVHVLPGSLWETPPQ